MAEKRDTLKGLDARFCAKLDEYDGKTCVNAWKNMTQGKVGAPVKTSPNVKHDGRRWVDNLVTGQRNNACDN